MEEEVMLTQETHETGVIYKIINSITGKIYIGYAKSYNERANESFTRRGATGRFKVHLSNAMSMNPDRRNECPALYEDIRNYGSNVFNVSILEIVPISQMKQKEKHYIKLYKSYDSTIGHNIWIGDERPLDEIRLQEFKEQKARGNVNRAVNGAMKREEHSKNLPPNINYRRGKSGDGFFAQIKINGTLYNKGFLSQRHGMEERLQMAIEWLTQIKLAHGNNEHNEHNEVMGNPDPSIQLT
jgi:hypothetical protein